MKKQLSLLVCTPILFILLTGCESPIIEKAVEEEINDPVTKEEVEFVEKGSDTFLIMYGGQNMDRGKYNFVTDRQIVLKKTSELQRGDIVYFKYPEDDGLPMYNPDDYLARVIGLPGETVEIRKGQVYINNKKLNTFYGESRRLGVTKEEWFKADKSTLTEEDFEVLMAPIKVLEASVFVQSDDWIMGTGSMNFGPIEIGDIEGKVLGYLKEN